MAREKICGIYKITNLINGKIYIGQSKDIYRRWEEHKKEAFKESSKEYHYPLYQSFREDGLENFTFEVLEECSQQDVSLKEEYYISLYESYPPDKGKGYNQTSGGGSPQNYTHNKIQKILSCVVKDLKETNLTYSEIANKYGIHQDTVGNINKGKFLILDGESYPLRFKETIFEQKIDLFCFICGVRINSKSKSGLCSKCLSKGIPYNSKNKLHGVKIQIPSKEDLLKDLYDLKKDYLVAEKYGVSTMLLKKWKEELGIPRKRPLVDKLYEEEYLGIIREEKPKRKFNLSVKQLDKNTGELIQTFSNLKEASQFIRENFQPNNSLENINACIHNCANGNIKSACGYSWEWIIN